MNKKELLHFLHPWVKKIKLNKNQRWRQKIKTYKQKSNQGWRKCKSNTQKNKNQRDYLPKTT